MKPLVLFVAVVLLALVLAAASAGCSGEAKREESRAGSETSARSATEEKASGKVILMMGRSVMGGWFSHWSGDSTKKTRRRGFELVPLEVSSPPDVVTSVADRLAEYSGKEDSVAAVYFKFCFDDFAGGGKQEAAESLKEKKAYLRHVYEQVVEGRKMRLIVGNALPKVKQHTDPFLVANERQFNEWLAAFASEHQGVVVFDQYSVLADEDGSLRAEYATGPDDSHPNEAGYKALDRAFDELLAEL